MRTLFQVLRAYSFPLSKSALVCTTAKVGVGLAMILVWASLARIGLKKWQQELLWAQRKFQGRWPRWLPEPSNQKKLWPSFTKSQSFGDLHRTNAISAPAHYPAPRSSKLATSWLSFYLRRFMQGLVTAFRFRLGQRLEQSQIERYSLWQDSQSIKCFPIARFSDTVRIRLLQ